MGLNQAIAARAALVLVRVRFWPAESMAKAARTKRIFLPLLNAAEAAVLTQLNGRRPICTIRPRARAKQTAAAAAAAAAKANERQYKTFSFSFSFARSLALWAPKCSTSVRRNLVGRQKLDLRKRTGAPLLHEFTDAQALLSRLCRQQEVALTTLACLSSLR